MLAAVCLRPRAQSPPSRLFLAERRVRESGSGGVGVHMIEGQKPRDEGGVQHILAFTVTLKGLPSLEKGAVNWRVKGQREKASLGRSSGVESPRIYSLIRRD